MSDTINQLAGIAPESALARLRDRRAQARQSAEESFQLLLSPVAPGDFSIEDRRAIAFFVAALHGDAASLAFYEGLAKADPRLAAIRVEGDRAAGRGPWGHFPEGPLRAENSDGQPLRVPEASGLEPRLARGLEHAHLLVLHPRDAAPASLQALLDAGWSPAAIVTLSQLVAFLSFQIRAAIGLRALASA